MKRLLKQTLGIMISLALILSLIPTVFAADKVIEVPIVIDGSELAGITEPTGISGLTDGEGYYHCDNDCGAGYYVSNEWFKNGTTQEATEFVDGEEYYFQISVHPKDGYKFPEGVDMDTAIEVTGVKWDHTEGGGISSYGGIYYTEFHITYDADKGITPADKEIELPIVIDGSELAGITEPTGIASLPESEEYYHCDVSCGLSEYWASNIWVDENYDVVTEFVDGETYIYQITIHAKDGYKFPDEIDEHEAFAVTGVEWDYVYCTISSSYDNVAYAEFKIIYDAETGIPKEKVVELPIVIDGSELAGTTVPTSISSLPTGDTFEYCDGACSDERFAANAWFDADDFPVDEFVAGYDYYYQISIHPTEGYHFPADISELEDIEVTGVEWETVNYYYDSAKDLYYANFWIHYDGNGIPALKEVEFPIVIDGSELVGITEPTGIANLPESEEYYHCDASCELSEYWASNIWVDKNYDVVTEFVDGNKYIYQITIHAKDGYKFPDEIDENEAFAVTGVEWDYVYCNIANNVAYAEFKIIYNAETGIPAEKVVDLPIVIDGSELAGITEPTGIANLPESEEYYFCDDSCGGGWYVSNKWFDTSDNEVTEFVDGEKYYFQISIHPQNGYLIPEDFDYDTGIKVEGVNWDYVRGHIMQKDSVIYYYVENYITYNAETGIPGTEELLKGDINKDGKISIVDVVMARAHIVKTKTLTEEQIKLGDMNGDNKISIVDVVMMRKAIVSGNTF